MTLTNSRTRGSVRSSRARSGRSPGRPRHEEAEQPDHGGDDVQHQVDRAEAAAGPAAAATRPSPGTAWPAGTAAGPRAAACPAAAPSAPAGGGGGYHGGQVAGGHPGAAAGTRTGCGRQTSAAAAGSAAGRCRARGRPRGPVIRRTVAAARGRRQAGQRALPAQQLHRLVQRRGDRAAADRHPHRPERLPRLAARAPRPGPPSAPPRSPASSSRRASASAADAGVEHLGGVRAGQLLLRGGRVDLDVVDEQEARAGRRPPTARSCAPAPAGRWPAARGPAPPSAAR